MCANICACGLNGTLLLGVIYRLCGSSETKLVFDAFRTRFDLDEYEVLLIPSDNVYLIVGYVEIFF